MSVKHLKYTNKTTGETVRAIKVTEKNFQNIADWIRGTEQSVGRKFKQAAEALWDFDEKVMDVYGQRVKVRTPKGWRVARVGEFIIRQGAYDPRSRTNDYDFSVGKDEFERNFRKGA